MKRRGNINDNNKERKPRAPSISKYLWQKPENKKPKNRIVGVIGDSHFPFNDSRYIPFLIETFEKFGVTDVVHIGDMVDNHSLSRHNTHPDAVGNITEKELAQELVDELVDVFPYLHYCLGNHCKIPQRQAATLGLSSMYLKSFSELWNLPETWSVKEKHIIDGVVYTHGTGNGGKDGALNGAIKNRMSTVIGHAHSYAGIKYQSNGVDTIFGMNVGCGIDQDTYAMAYGKDYPNKPVLSCGIVFDDKNGMVVVMSE